MSTLFFNTPSIPVAFDHALSAIFNEDIFVISLYIFPILLIDPGFRQSLLNFLTDSRHRHPRLLLRNLHARLCIILRYRMDIQRYPFSFFAILCIIVMLAGGVTVLIGLILQKCGVITEYRPYLPPDEVLYSLSGLETSTQIIVLNHMRMMACVDFNERERAGMLRRVLGVKRFPTIPNNTSFPDVVSECNVVPVATYQPGQLEVTLKRCLQSPCSYEAGNFTEIGGERRRFSGMGSTVGSRQRTIFVFHEDTKEVGAESFLYLEYSFRKYVEDVFLHKIGYGDVVKSDEKITERNEKSVTAYRVWCGENILTTEDFLKIVTLYRMEQLKFEMEEREVLGEKESFKVLTKDDLVRAVSSAKLMDDYRGMDSDTIPRFTIRIDHEMMYGVFMCLLCTRALWVVENFVNDVIEAVLRRS